MTESVDEPYEILAFEWDPAKSTRNERERGLPFHLAIPLFDGFVAEWADFRRDYGEIRIQAIGEVNQEVFVCVYTIRETRRRIISLRRASRRERNVFRASHPS